MTHKEKDFTTSMTHLVNSSLDNVKTFIDHTADEVAKADIIGANRRIADQLIEGTKETVNKVAESAAKSDPVAAVRNLATGTLDSAKNAVRVASEESQRINLIETGSRVTQESLELVRRQVELGFEASADLGHVVDRLMPFKASVPTTDKRPGVVTRVEIESDKGTVKTETRDTSTSSNSKK